jgi:hypothetical protein
MEAPETHLRALLAAAVVAHLKWVVAQDLQTLEAMEATALQPLFLERPQPILVVAEEALVAQQQELVAQAVAVTAQQTIMAVVKTVVSTQAAVAVDLLAAAHPRIQTLLAQAALALSLSAT